MLKFEIYRLISPSGKSYIGLTCRPFKTRLVCHISDWKNNRRGCKKLCRAFDKYDPKLWTYESLFITNNKEEAQEKEIQYIKEFNSIENGYNILPGGIINRIGLLISEETRVKLSIAGKQWKRLPMSEEQKHKLSVANLGKKLSEETKQKMSKTKKGVIPWNKGVKLTDKHKNNLRLTLQNKTRPTFSEEWKTHMSQAHKNVPLSEDHKRNISLANKGRLAGKNNPMFQKTHTEEAKAKISLASKERWKLKKLEREG